MKRIPIYSPSLTDLERNYLLQAFDSGWISSRGEFVSRFQDEFVKKVNRKHGLSVVNGTVGLHVAIEACKLKYNIKPNDKNCVLCPSLTYVATANAIRHAGLIPFFIDVNKYGVIDDQCVETGIKQSKLKNLNPIGIVPVHLYGNMCSLSSYNNMFIVEDCAESFGSFLNNKVCGDSDSDFCCYSFFGNKTITTGEGGMVVCDDDELFNNAFMFRNTGQQEKSLSVQSYTHFVVGYNYRMTNLCAAIGLAQLERSQDILNKKHKIMSWYKEKLGDLLLPESPNTKSSYWMVTILVRNGSVRDGLSLYLDGNNIETRPTFFPMHLMPNLLPYDKVDDLKTSEHISNCGINLPSFPDLTKEEVDFVCDKILEFLKKC